MSRTLENRCAEVRHEIHQVFRSFCAGVLLTLMRGGAPVPHRRLNPTLTLETMPASMRLWENFNRRSAS